MKIKQAVLDKINNVACRMRIATQLGIGEPAIAAAINRNTDNGSLTKIKALKIIAVETGLDVEEILETERSRTNGTRKVATKLK